MPIEDGTRIVHMGTREADAFRVKTRRAMAITPPSDGLDRNVGERLPFVNFATLALVNINRSTYSPSVFMRTPWGW